MPKIAVVLFISVAISSMFLLQPRHVKANVGEAYGFGPRTAALGGATVAWGFDGYASYINPAGLGLKPSYSDKRLTLSWGIVHMDPRFRPIDNIIVENTYTSDKQTSGNVDNSYRSTSGQVLGLSYRLFPESFNFTFGMTYFMPLSQAAYLDTGEPFVPEYVLYRTRTQRPQLEMAIGADLGRGVHIGSGLHLSFALTSNAIVMLQSDTTKPSTMRFSSSLKPKASPYFGLLFLPAKDDSLSLGLVLRFPSAADNFMTLRSGARVFGSFDALDFNFLAASALFYDPLSVELGGSWQHAHNARLFWQLDYQAWGKFQAPALLIQDPSITDCADTSCGMNISSGNNPKFDYKNIFVPRIGEEISIGKTAFRLGYSYRPSFLKNLPTEAGNYLDPPKHMMGIGAGFEFSRFLSFYVPCKLDLNLSYHHLVSQHVDKTDGDEKNTGVGNQKIGAPGYDTGGKIIGGGVSLTLVF